MASATEKLLSACNSLPDNFWEGITSLYRLAVTITSPRLWVSIESDDEGVAAPACPQRAAPITVTIPSNTLRQSLSIGLFF